MIIAVPLSGKKKGERREIVVVGSALSALNFTTIKGAKTFPKTSREDPLTNGTRTAREASLFKRVVLTEETFKCCALGQMILARFEVNTPF